MEHLSGSFYKGKKSNTRYYPNQKGALIVGYDDGSNSIKYYNAETGKVLTSQNFRSLQLPVETKPPEPIVITPNIQHEGKSGAGHMLQLGVTPEAERSSGPDGPRKQK